MNSVNICYKIFAPVIVGVTTLHPSLSNAQAVQGSIKPSSLSDTKEAIRVLESCISSVKEMDTDISKSDYQAIGDKLSGDYLILDYIMK